MLARQYRKFLTSGKQILDSLLSYWTGRKNLLLSESTYRTVPVPHVSVIFTENLHHFQPKIPRNFEKLVCENELKPRVKFRIWYPASISTVWILTTEWTEWTECWAFSPVPVLCDINHAEWAQELKRMQDEVTNLRKAKTTYIQRHQEHLPAPPSPC